ncbi:MAG TPA: methyltransferase, partial [Solirubrobacteraceae bacterium]
VIEGTRARLADWGLTDRCEAIAGDFFEAVPAGGDAYVLSWILHDWNDQSAVRILANCHAAMGDAGRLLAIELVVPCSEQQASPDLEWLVKTTDVEMLAVVGGRERTAAEYGKLYTSAGFQLTRIMPLKPSAWSVIEGSPS